LKLTCPKLTMSKTETKINQLVEIFNQLFGKSENTRLETGAEEPFYQAAKSSKFASKESAIIFSRDDYFSSALHEIAHWTIAGKERRQLDDFGYWYEPEGRSAEQQLEFEQVEVKPQAVEWLFSLACNHPFYFSADNLSQSLVASDEFIAAVKKQARDYLNDSPLPDRAALLFKQLKQYYRNNKAIDAADVRYV